MYTSEMELGHRSLDNRVSEPDSSHRVNSHQVGSGQRSKFLAQFHLWYRYIVTKLNKETAVTLQTDILKPF